MESNTPKPKANYGINDDSILRNMLYDLCKIRCQLHFINKSKDFCYFEELKQKIISSFSIVKLMVVNFNKHLLLQFYESSPLEIPLIQTSNKTNISIYFAFDQKEKRERFLIPYKTSIQGMKNNEKRAHSFIFLSRDINNIQSDMPDSFFNVFFCPAYEHEFLMGIIYQRVIEQLDVYVSMVLSQKDIFTSSSRMKDIKKEDAERRCNEYMQLKNLDHALKIVNKACDYYSGIEEAKWKEIKGIILAQKDIESLENKMQSNVNNVKELQKPENLKFTEQIGDLFDFAFNKYKKEKKYELLVEANLRLLTYYSYLNGVKIEKMRSDLASTIYNEDWDFGTKKFVYYMKAASIYKKTGQYRKAYSFLQYALLTCYANNDLFPLVPYILDEISKKLYVYDSSKTIINSEDEFKKFHRQIILNYRKPIMFYLNKNGELKETNKKKFDKTLKLIVINHRQNFPNSCFLMKWFPIQRELYFNILNFHTEKDKSPNVLNRIKYSISYLQLFTNYNNLKDEQRIFYCAINDSLQLQEKIMLNLSKIPLLMRIIPLSSEIKFDISENPKKDKNNKKPKVFLYNPWEKNVNTNYYWTANSNQNIKVQLYNPLTVELLISKIFIEFKGVKPLCYPSSILISPKSSVFIICKVQFLEEGITNVIGLKYEIVNIIGKQYVDNNGNGLYYNFENISDDMLNIINNKKEVISLTNIKIYPEIPLLKLKLLDKVITPTIVLYEHQYHTFSFLLENVGSFDIDELNCFIYVYKKDNYKVSLDEIKIQTLIKVGGSYIFEYKYLHKSTFKKFEFRLYYISYSKNAKSEEKDDILIKPYLYYTKSFETLEFINFTSKKIIPMVTNGASNQLRRLDIRLKKNFSAYFCSKKQYLNFVCNNTHESPMNITIINSVNNDILKEELCEKNKLKEISFLIDSYYEFSKLILKWKFVNMDDCQGKIDLITIFPNLNVSEFNAYTFDINIQKFMDEGRVKCNYIIKNNQNIKRTNLKVFFYLYQRHNSEDGVEFEYNASLSNNIFYNGSLTIDINTLDEYETYNYDIDVYPLYRDIINTTFLLVDNNNENIYMCPISKNISLK